MEPAQEFRILVIDDEKSNLMVLNRILSTEYTVFTAKTGKEGLERAIADQPDLILLDIVMPDLNGFDVLTTFKKTPETMKIPVIVITGLSDETDEERGFLLGAVDYITKPFKNPIVLARVRTHIQIIHQIRTIEQLGLIDGLTNVPNRRCFDDRVALEWRRAAREKNPISFLMMDVDKFKTYNDTYGHPQGDVLLKSIAKIFSAAAMRTTDLAARLGGEEFGILLPDTDLSAALVIAEKIRSGVEAIRIPTADGKTITTATISIGAVSAVPDDKATVQEFLSAADKRLYTAKNTGRNRVCSEN
ncbi:diguanylate cyclase domain-containing protein [Treponema primitia]|uniref:diguanylate cyclase domain-containing protein n=1 Tax=Treponema primitia TaxID=88058 RepID=UPI0002555799|nr:diguanylate cyclase [Treponema primitia]